MRTFSKTARKTMASPPSFRRKLDLAAPRPALRPPRRCGPFAKMLGQPPTGSRRRWGDCGRQRKAIPKPLRPTPSPSRWKIELDGSLSATTTARPLRTFGGHPWAPVRGVTVAIGRPWPPLRSHPALPRSSSPAGCRHLRAFRLVQRHASGAARRRPAPLAPWWVVATGRCRRRARLGRPSPSWARRRSTAVAWFGDCDVGRLSLTGGVRA